jgi:formate/nitrite transporter FocA (FNT family)
LHGFGYNVKYFEDNANASTAENDPVMMRNIATHLVIERYGNLICTEFEVVQNCIACSLNVIESFVSDAYINDSKVKGFVQAVSCQVIVCLMMMMMMMMNSSLMNRRRIED